jgi:branched-chain amino acid transport system permease protein
VSTFIALTVFGLYSGAAYAIAASGLVLTYATTRVFNIAHGAFGMLLSFVFWDFSVRQGMPVLVALFLVLFVVAPAIGYLIARFIAKDLGDAPVSVSLVVTVALLVICYALATIIYPSESRVVAPFFPETSFAVGSGRVTAHQIITIVASLAVAALIYILLTRTRIGTAMRAAVDNPELLRLFGGNPDQVAALSWMIGISLAGLGGILLVSLVGLDYFTLTLLVINAFAAAAFGRLKSLPMTFVGAMGLGLLSSYLPSYWQPEGELLSQVKNILPALFLFVVVIVSPQAQLRIGQVKGLVAAPLPSMPRALACAGGLLALVGVMSVSLEDATLLKVGTMATFSIMMLSIVLLTGYGGHVSLAQFAFLGVGALAYAKLDSPNLFGLLVSAVIAAGVGALVALPVLRLTGLYLALATLAFASIMDKMVFQSSYAFGFNGTLPAERMSILGRSIESTSAYVFVMAVFFVLVSLLLLAVRKGVIGRFLIAMRDSPAAAGTLGLDSRWFRVGLFGASAGIAGLAGALYSGLRGTVGASDFQFFDNFTLLLFVVVMGATSVTGAALGGMGLVMFDGSGTQAQAIILLIIAVMAILLARNPNGLAMYLFRGGSWLQRQLLPKIMESLPALPGRAGAADEAADAAFETADGEVASRNDGSVVNGDETVVTAVAGEAKEVVGHDR